MFESQVKMVAGLRENYSDKFVFPQPETPQELVEAVTAQIGAPFDSSILVLFTVEWALYLREIGYTNICVSTKGDATVQKLCQALGFVYQDISEIEKNNMKFDVVVGNPPYQQGKNNNFYQDFVKIAFTVSTDIVAMVTPSNWTSFADKDSKFLSLLKKNGLNYYKFLGSNAFKNVQLLTVVFICSKKSNSNVVSINTDTDTITVPVDDLCYFPTASADLFKTVSKIAALKLPGISAVKGNLDRNKVIPDINGIKCIMSVGKRGGDFDIELVSSLHLERGEIVGIGSHKVVISRITSIGKLGEAKYAGPEYACAQGCYAIYTDSKDSALRLIEYLNSPVVKAIVQELKGSVCSNSQNIFSTIPAVEYADSMIACLTPEEINLIESMVK